MTEQVDLFGEDAGYLAFEQKFKPKKTTDDCYTPPIVYDAVAGWAASEYGLDRGRFLRPFRPGGDFEREDYPAGCAVVDNPPFSILSRIIRFYTANRVPFFLFAPTLTLFTAPECPVTYYPCGVSVTYENGAVVNTSFVSNLEPETVIRLAPELYQAVAAANAENLCTQKSPPLPKYEYPDHVITAAIAARYCKYGVSMAVPRAGSCYINGLDAQKRVAKNVFGGGYLLSERAAAHVWVLSARERALVDLLTRQEAKRNGGSETEPGV